MARYKAMKSAVSVPEPVPTKDADQASSVEPAGFDDGLVLSEEGLDPERLARLRAVWTDQSSPRVREAVRQSAIVWARTPVRAEATDRNGMRTLVRALLAYADEQGSVDASRALRRAAVDRYLARLSRGKKETNSARAYKNILYTAGRALRPTEFPKPLAAPGRLLKPRPPAEAREEAEAYAALASMPVALRRRAAVVLDLVTGAGACSPEMVKVRGTDVRAMTVSGRRVAVVRLVSQGGRPREVPVVDAAKAGRLLAAAEAAGSSPLLSSLGGLAPGRSAVSGIAGEMREHGHAGFEAARLRRRWTMWAGERVPALMWLGLIGTYYCGPLTKRPEDVPRVDVARAARLLMEGMGE